MTSCKAKKFLLMHFEYLKKSWKPYPDYNVLEAIRFAISAIEKQIPKKVKNSGERIPFEWYCPACGELLCDDGYKDTDIKYCDQCGQVLDWENT